MSFYDNKSCPVCGNAFEEGDDIVVCPECGTPHHRECYNLSGHCVNAGLHKSGYSYYEENKPEEQPAQEAPATDDAFSPFEIPVYQYEKDSEPVSGERAVDVAAAVRTNIPRFILKFRDMEKTGKKRSWNWGAFFFGELYFFYRKMYRQAVALISLSIAISLSLSLLIEKFAPKTLEALEALAEAYSKQDTSALTEKANAVMAAADYQTYQLIVFSSLAVILIIRIIEAMFADYAYKNTVILLVKRVKEQLEQGASFNQNSILPIGEAPELSQEQMKWVYLSRRGGTTFFAPLLAMLAVELILRFI